MCRRDIEASFGLIERDYAGYADKFARLGAETIDRAKQEALAGAARSDSVQACRKIFGGWLSVFEDRHFSLTEPTPPSGPASTPAAGQPATAPIPAPVGQGRDPDAPSIETVSGSVSLVRVPSFDLRFRKLISELVAQHREETGRPYLILDLRGNRGGGDSAYSALAELIATGPVRIVGVDILASPENIAGWERALLDVPEDAQKELQPLVDRMRENSGRFVSMGPDQTIERKPIVPSPSQVAVLIDGKCASSCEQFLLEARASRKVRIFGKPSAGTLDYSNVVDHVLPSGRQLGIPTSRSRRLPDEPIDGIGVIPDVEMDPALFEGESRAEAIGRVLAELARSTAQPLAD